MPAFEQTQPCAYLKALTTLGWSEVFDRALIHSLDRTFGYFGLTLGLWPQEEAAFVQLKTQHLIRLISAQELSCQSLDIQAEPLRYHFVIGDYEDWPFKTHGFDWVALPLFLPTTTDPYHILRQTDRVLRTEGVVVISSLHPWVPWIRWLKSKGHWTLFKGMHFISMRLVMSWLNLLGYEVIEVQYIYSQRWSGRFQKYLFKFPWLAHWISLGYQIKASKTQRRVRPVRLSLSSWFRRFVWSPQAASPRELTNQKNPYEES